MLDQDNRANAITKIAFAAHPEDRDFVVAEAAGGQKRHQTYILAALLNVGGFFTGGNESACILISRTKPPSISAL
jgi:hypothetical protein